jgi:hypothetical protein
MERVQHCIMIGAGSAMKDILIELASIVIGVTVGVLSYYLFK